MEAKKEGEIMSLDAIKQVAQAEAETKQRKADAAIAARKLISDAEQAEQLIAIRSQPEQPQPFHFHNGHISYSRPF